VTAACIYVHDNGLTLMRPEYAAEGRYRAAPAVRWPKFVISYSLTRKAIKGAKQSYDVTEIDLTKTAKP
jgi:hypothetical protein